MKKFFLFLSAAFLSIFMKAQDDAPLATTITFAQFDQVVKGIVLDGYNCFLTAEDPSVYSALFTVNQLNGSMGIFNLDFYDMVSSNRDNFTPVKEYEINGHKAYLGTNNNIGEDEIPMNVLIVLYPEQKLTIMINTEVAMPISTMEEIIRQINF